MRGGSGKAIQVYRDHRVHAERAYDADRDRVDEAAKQFLEAPIQTFVPILVEHVVRNRIFATRESKIFLIVDMDALDQSDD